MHPSGVQFGLSRGLLQLKGEEVLLSDKLLETISVEAQVRLHLGKPADRREFPGGNDGPGRSGGAWR